MHLAPPCCVFPVLISTAPDHRKTDSSVASSSSSSSSSFLTGCSLYTKLQVHWEKVMDGCVGIAILACRTRLLDPNPAAMSDGVATIRISSSWVLQHATEIMSVFSASFKFFFFFFLQCLFTNLQVQDLQFRDSGFARIAISLNAVRFFPNPAISSSAYSAWIHRRDECWFVFFGRLLVPDFHGHW